MRLPDRRTGWPRLERAARYGCVSTMTLVNAIMTGGHAKASDATNNASTSPASVPPQKSAPKAGVSTVKPKSPKKSAPLSPIEQLDTIVVLGKMAGSPYQATQASSPDYTEPLLDTSETITIVPQALIKDQNATTLRDILKNVPGISFQAGEGSSTVSGDNLSIRGFNARDDTFIDGIRDIGVYFRDPFNTEQVEVVKGPASAYEGYGETGGSINLVSKTPQLTPDYEVTGGVGTNQYNRETIDVNQPLPGVGIDGVAVRLDAVQQYNQFADRDFVYDSRWGAAPSIAFGLGTPTRVTLSYLHLREDDLPFYGFPFVTAPAIAPGTFPASDLNKVAPVPYNNFYGSINSDHETAINDMPTLTVEHDFDDDIKLLNQARYDRTSYLAFDTSARFGTPPPLTYDVITQEPSSRDQVDTLLDDRTFVTVPFEAWKVPNTLVTSLELSRQIETVRQGVGPFVDTNISDPDVYATYGAMTRTDTDKNHIDDVAFSVFDTVKFTPQLELTGGARYDHLDSSYVDPGPLTPSAYDRTDDLASWRAAMVYKPVPFGSIYVGYGTSFNPSIQGTSDGASNDALTASTANLPPEEDISYEIGTKWDLLDEKLSLTAALFRTDKTNARVVDPTSPAGTTVYALAGEQRVRGVEVDVAGNLTEAWKIFGGYVYMQSEVLSGPPSSDPGNTLPNTPNQSASLWTTYDLPWNFTVGTGFQFMDQRYSLVNDLNSAPGYYTEDAMLAYKVSKNVDVQLNVSNLWDEHYIDLVGAHQDIPGPGRSFTVTTHIKF